MRYWQDNERLLSIASPKVARYNGVWPAETSLAAARMDLRLGIEKSWRWDGTLKAPSVCRRQEGKCFACVLISPPVFIVRFVSEMLF